VKRQTEAETAPFKRITSAILHAASECEKKIDPLIYGEGETDHDRIVRKMFVFHEILFFFVYLMDRAAFSKLGSERRTKLQKIVFPVIADVAVDTFMQRLPVEDKKIMRFRFYEGMNESGLDYATATGWISKEKPFLGDSLIAKLGRKVSKQSGSEYNPVIMTVVAKAASDEMRSARP
jgi:hypothetical protein